MMIHSLVQSEDPKQEVLRVSGQIIYQSPNVFTITTPSTLSTSSKALHRDAAPAASLTKDFRCKCKNCNGCSKITISSRWCIKKS